MNFVGIIAEYDPFHSGHALQLRMLRQRGASTIAVCMSTGVVQRGGVPILPEAVRVRAALAAGADLVVALPAPYANASAEQFAASGVHLLAALGCDTLAFGAETPEPAPLQAAAAALCSAAFPAALRSQLLAGQKLTGDEGDVVIVMSRPVYDKLMLSDESKLKPFQFRQGSLEFFVKSINGIPIIPVPSKRMQTEYIFDANGFFPAIRAEPINWIICPKSAPIAISKTDSVKIIPPGDNQFADAWDIDYRKYHDLLIPDNTKALIAVSVASEQEGRS